MSYKRMLDSIINAGMKPKVIGAAIGKVECLRPLFYEFDPLVIVENCSTVDVVVERIKKWKPEKEFLIGPKTIFSKFCKSILSAAEFLAQFPTVQEFHEWVSHFDRDERSRVALPLLLAAEVDGLGFALACDFLKEIGYTNYPKPDVHLKEIFVDLKLCRNAATDLEVFKAITRVARHCALTPYTVDKHFWFIGSGNFYNHPELGVNGKVRTSKRQFIEWANKRLDEGSPAIG